MMEEKLKSLFVHSMTNIWSEHILLGPFGHAIEERSAEH